MCIEMFHAQIQNGKEKLDMQPAFRAPDVHSNISLILQKTSKNK